MDQRPIPNSSNASFQTGPNQHVPFHHAPFQNASFQNALNPTTLNQNAQNPNVLNQNAQNPNMLNQNAQNPNLINQNAQNQNLINQSPPNPNAPNVPMPSAPNEPMPTAPDEQQPRASTPLLEKIQQLGQTNVPQMSQDSRIHCLSIVGQIEGHMQLPPQNKTTKYEHVIPQIVAIEQNPNIEGLLVILNTVGGDVEAGLAISEMLASLSKPTVSIVLGGGHSIGVPIAVSCDYSFIAETATMTIHPIRLTGLVIGVPQTFEYLDKMQDRVVNFVTKHSRISEEKFKELMFAVGNLTRDIGTNVVGTDAVGSGLMDEVGGIGQAMNKLNELIEESKAKGLNEAGMIQ